MKDLFATLPDDPAPPLAAGYLDSVLRRGRRSARRRLLGTAAVWTIVVLAVAGLAVPALSLPDRPAAPAAKPSLPERFAGYSVLTGTVGASPAGRAIALYGYGNGELFNMFQPVVAGADRNTYRRVDAMEDRGRPSALLSPDGTSVLLGDDYGATRDLVLVDLTTGRRRSVPIGEPVGVRLLAWSPDGRYVAYSAGAVGDNPDRMINFVDDEVRRSGELRLLDLATHQSRAFPAVHPAATAAFAGDGGRLAVQVDQRVQLFELDGRSIGTVEIPAGRELAAGVGWTPDGRFLATVPSGFVLHSTFLWNEGDVTFVPVTDGATPPAPVTGVVQVLGWRSATKLVAATLPMGLSSIDLTTGARERLSLFDTGSTCELGMQSCQVFDLQLATGLLADATVRPASSPDRGPWPLALTIPIAVVLLGATYLLWRRLRR
ncbi:WD40 repeat domain-containing protein [Dactylosporangium sp. AC04546]|uniref:WD40 repeat domain-containing protein n=1 Tax=Dactylosporangium sp. AC04546 TaxID=2862460 RepID=UPI001EDDCE8E|nr:WD40 repeat domain-containing protein [Dactylosporangium sp. AC04546]WVK82920.1 WD40 repeat domain-containing protein [Dactylosporangium sp. AC04546]